MSKLIIENRTQGEITDAECLDYVAYVIRAGKISNDGKQYCYASTYTHQKGRVNVYAEQNKISNKFIITIDLIENRLKEEMQKSANFMESKVWKDFASYFFKD